MRLLWAAASGMALLLIVLLFPIHTRLTIVDWRVETAYPAVSPFVSLGAFGGYVLVWRYAVLAVFLAVAALIAARRWNSGLGLLVSLVLFTVPVNFQLAGYTDSWFIYPAVLRPLLRNAASLNSVVSLSAFAAMFYLFPNGRAVPRWLGWVGLGLLGLSLGSAVVVAAVRPPLGNGLWPWFVTVFLVLLALGLGGQVYRYFRVSTPDERRQTQLVVLALFAFVGGFGTSMFGLTFGSATRRAVVNLLELHLELVSLVGLPLSLAVSMLRRRLWSADPLLNRALVYAALTAAVIGVYVLVVGGLGALFNAQGSALLAVAATGLVAVLFQPLREYVQRAANRLMYGDRDDPAAAINRLGQRLEATLAPEAVLPTLTETVAHALRLPYAAIALRQDDAFHLAAEFTSPAAHGHRALADPGDVLPIVYQGEVIGQLIVAPRAAGERLEPADRRLLEQMARQASPAVHAVRLAADLQRSRERLVTAREEERRRLRRDLHDGLGSTLAALHLQAGVLRALVANPVSMPAAQPPAPESTNGGDPPAARNPAQAAVDDLRVQIRAAVGEIRRMVYDLRPPALDELGLAGAIRARAAQMEQGGEAGMGSAVPVLVEAPETLPPLPAAVEVAAYRIAQEALTNVARHANARSCRVRLWLGDGGLGLEVEDDGVGLPAARPVGLGLRSMHERAAELGGAFRLRPRPGGGTLVSVWLPAAGYTQANG